MVLNLKPNLIFKLNVFFTITLKLVVPKLYYFILILIKVLKFLKNIKLLWAYIRLY